MNEHKDSTMHFALTLMLTFFLFFIHNQTCLLGLFLSRLKAQTLAF